MKMSDDDQATKMKIKFKTTTETFETELNLNVTVLQAKEVLSARVNQPSDKLCLIFSGKILKDHETLEQHSITDGKVVHMVIRNPASKNDSLTPSSKAPQSNPPPQTRPNATAPNPFGQLGAAQGMMNNPEFMQQMMNSPIMQSLMNNPEVIRSMITENPQIQQVIQQNPELGHLLNDPEVLRQTMEMIRNPNMFNELMRNHDRAIHNLQGMPGGEAALQRLYQDVQEPLLSSAAGSLAGNPFASLIQQQDNASSRSQRAGVENAEALPNPWSSSTNQNAQGGSIAHNTGNGSAIPNLGGMSGMMNSPGMQSLMRQIMSNPEMMRNMMSSDNINMMNQLMGQNPDIMRQMMGSMPGMQNNPQFLQQMQNLMQNPQAMQAMTNPRVLQALQQMHEAMRVLQTEAPQLFDLQNMGNMFGANLTNLISGAISTAAPATGTTATLTPGIPSDSTNRTVPANNTNSPSNDQAQMLFNMMQQLAGFNLATGQMGSANQVPSEERFRSQLEQLVQMGFTDQEANIRALTSTFGDVNAAIDRLLNGPN